MRTFEKANRGAHKKRAKGLPQERRLPTPPSSKSAKPSIIWQRRHEHYTALAQAAALKGNVVDAEYNYQHAEHYFRMLQGTAA